MAPSPKIKAVRGFVWLSAAVAAIFAAFVFLAPEIFYYGAKIEAKSRLFLGNRLKERHSLLFLASLDGPHPANGITDEQISVFYAPIVKGKFRDGREIVLGKRNAALFPPHHIADRSIGEATFSMWIKPKDAKRSQVLVNSANYAAGLAVVLEEGFAAIRIFSGGKELSAKAQFPEKKDAFTHIAATVSSTRAALFIDGRESAHIDLPAPARILPRQPAFFSECHRPYEGAIDDIAIWGRALPQEEISRIARGHRPVREMLEPSVSMACDLVKLAMDFSRCAARTVERIFPLRNSMMDASMPLLSVRMSKEDERHFSREHALSLKYGYRTEKGENLRRIKASMNGKCVKARLALDNLYGNRGIPGREAFILRDESGDLFGQKGFWRIYPPEMHLFVHPDAPRPLPLNPDLVRLSIDGTFKGVYVLEKFENYGSAWMARGKRCPDFKDALYFDSMPSAADVFHANGIDGYRGCLKAASSDVRFTISRAEIKARERLLGEKRKMLLFSDKKSLFPGVKSLLGKNIAAFYVTGDLSLPLDGFAWESSRPGLISPDGKVHRPQDGSPQCAILTATECATGAKWQGEFRVMPKENGLDAIFLFPGTPLEKYRRSDFTAIYAAADGKKHKISGFGKAGIKHRGNTSYAKGAKRSMSLKFDEECASKSPLFSKHMLLLSGYADPTRMRNKLSYESFRALSPKGDATANIAPKISWIEVFINGEYFGVWEKTSRPQDAPEAKDRRLYKVRAFNSSLWKSGRSSMTEYIGNVPADGDPYAPLKDLFRFTGTAADGEFKSGIGKRISLENAAANYLLVNFTGNADGRVTNHIITHDGEIWSIVPWDYDKTFGKKFEILGNHLYGRLESSVPAYREILKETWKRAREGGLNEEALSKSIGEDARLLAPYMKFEYALLKPTGFDLDFDAAVMELSSAVKRQLEEMDRLYGR